MNEKEPHTEAQVCGSFGSSSCLPREAGGSSRLVRLRKNEPEHKNK